VRDWRFFLLIRGRNCEKYAKKCLSSIKAQTIAKHEHVIILDAPTDNTEKVVRAFKFNSKHTSPYVWTARQGLAWNMWFGIKKIAEHQTVHQPYGDGKGDSCLINDEDVVAVVDLDDWLPNNALSTVRKVYDKHPNCLVTYGSYIKVSKGRKTKISKPYPVGADVRKHKFHASHLKTIKWKVLKNLPVDCLKDKNGNWLQAASDVAMIIPCMEMAGLENCYHVSTPTYYWRDNTPHKTNRALQIKCEKIVRAKKKLGRLF